MLARRIEAKSTSNKSDAHQDTTMTYRIARNGQLFGPYTEEEVRRYIASGHIVFTDLAQAEGSAEWYPIAQLFPPVAVAGAPSSSVSPTLYPDPPDLPWWIALIIGICTGGIFFVAWDIVQAAWMRRVDMRSIALWFYVAAAVLFIINAPWQYHNVSHWMFGTPLVIHTHDHWLGGGRWILWLIARFVFRSELLNHYNGPEPIGLSLSGIMTFFFGGLYFQYHFNRINEIKRSLRGTFTPARSF
jgi:GYF domain 2